MQETLLIGDFLFVNKFEYGPKIPFTHIRLPGLHSPRRGDVIVFQFPQDPSKDFIKRAIATGGETIEIKDKVVSVDGKPLDESYVVHADDSVRPPEGAGWGRAMGGLACAEASGRGIPSDSARPGYQPAGV